MGARLHDGGNWESVQGRMERRLFAGRASGARERRSPDGYRGVLRSIRTVSPCASAPSRAARSAGRCLYVATTLAMLHSDSPRRG